MNQIDCEKFESAALVLLGMNAAVGYGGLVLTQDEKCYEVREPQGFGYRVLERRDKRGPLALISINLSRQGDTVL